MSKTIKAAKSVFIIIMFTLGSKFLGFIREMLIAAKFGSGFETDTFFIAITAITLFTSMITNSINTTMIPVLSEIEAKEGKIGKGKHTNNLLNINIIISICIIIIASILAPVVIRILAAGFKGEQFKLAVTMMRIGLPAILFASIHGAFRGYLQSELLFTESAISDFPFNFVYILFLLSFSSMFGIKGLMVTSVLAVASRIILQIPGVRGMGFKYKLFADFKDIYVRKIIYLVPPVLISVGISDINEIVDRSMASALVQGSISALNYAGRLTGLIKGIFIAAITTVIYPMLSKEAQKDSLGGLKQTIVYGINIVLLITIPATIGMAVLAGPIVKVAFERGAFDVTATYMTVGALIFYSIGIIGSSLRSILYRVYYSLQDTKTPMTNSFISLCINVILNLILIRYMAHRGLALSTSISALTASAFLLFRLQKKIGPFGFTKSIKCGIKALLASIVMGIAVYFLNNYLINHMMNGTLGELLSLVILVSVGGLIYLLIIYFLKVEEFRWILNTLRNKYINHNR